VKAGYDRKRVRRVPVPHLAVRRDGHLRAGGTPRSDRVGRRRALYGLPQVAGVVPPVLAALVVFAIHYRLRAPDATSPTDTDTT